LSRHGFAAVVEAAFQIDGEWKALEMRRGKADPAKARSYQELPQQVRLEWDRGRVDVAALVQQRPKRRSRSFSLTGLWWGGWAGGAVEKNPVYEEMLLCISQSLELLLAARQPEAAQARLEEIDRRLSLETEIWRRKRRRGAIAIWIVAVIVFALLGLMVYLAANSH
jgi:hypothetical protein